MKIAIFGGSFNPVHLGHYTIVSQLLAIGKVDRVIVIPSYQNPLKKGVPVTPPKVRLEMLEKTFGELDQVDILDYEIKRKELSFTEKTLQHLKEKYPNDQLYLVMGEDSYAQFEHWKSPGTIVQYANLMVFFRPALREMYPTPENGIYDAYTEWIEVSVPDISATEIRNAPLDLLRNKPVLHPEAFKVWEKFKNAE